MNADRIETLPDGPVQCVHRTCDGPVYLWTVPAVRGWEARCWGLELAGSTPFETLVGANAYLFNAFHEMFPEHSCNEGCQSLDGAGQLCDANDMYFHPLSGDYDGGEYCSGRKKPNSVPG